MLVCELNDVSDSHLQLLLYLRLLELFRTKVRDLKFFRNFNTHEHSKLQKWFTPVIPALGIVMQVDNCELKASLS